MSARRSRQKIAYSDDDDFDAAPPQNASDSDDASEPEFDEDPEDFDDFEDEDHQPQEAEDSAEEAYEAEPKVSARPLRGGRPVRETKKRQLTFYEEDDLLDSDEEAPAPKKRVSVKLKIPRRAAPKKEEDFLEPEPEYRPDVLRMTERQRARLAEDEPNEKYEELMFARMDEQLLALNRKTQKKKETAEEIAVRKAENARKRADYKIKQLEEEKRDTLNKLLKRRANKTREKEDDDESDSKQTLKPRRPVVGHAALMRWVSLSAGSVLAFTE
ncbi:hypothetical protein METBIDRAFT_78406 [Metschnikowia bicuspidata var. bicuspidata NRRL YB-4993]|uniref:INO80 complex subunit B-like conserved region domain-containing protein n=1 Tax=Metschnikowia bicuspidata var. bicuspidata NRRL YB-4993 TaxID=869754 RepID=A0A1A0HBD8_9ASCO|nr:hypothetical protein METBIDRAFT_78406 [Metschnikowia bicuspidata var. bicuspidata NRRL YB-4993]OBA21449.1 hypothetical protein METBIDRAFT_78406 [Metschnikowia bicuspidata var. bicuspidata NRRL YB-4993]